MIRRIFLCLLLAVFVFSMAGCKKSSSDDESSVGDKSIAGYSAVKAELSEPYDSITEYAFHDNCLYVCGISSEGGDLKTKLCSFDSDLNLITKYDYSYSPNQQNALSIDVDSDGVLWALEGVFEDVLDADGNAIAEKAVNSIVSFNADGSLATSFVLNDLTWIPMRVLVVSDTIYVYGTDNISAYTKSGEPKFSLSPIFIESGVLAKRSNELLFLDTQDVSRLCAFDLNEKSFKAVEDFDIRFSHLYGDQEDIYLGSGDGVYSYNSDENTTINLFDWLPMGISEPIAQLYLCDDNYFLACGSREIYRIAPSDSLEEKTVITFATTQRNSFDNMIADFNSKNSEYVIELTDYSVYNTAGDDFAGQNKLTTEIISGKIPDIIDLGSFTSDLYYGNELLEDLMPYLESDSDIKIDELIPQVLDAMKIDGKLYSLIPLFSILTVTSSASGEELYSQTQPFGSMVSRAEMLQLAASSSKSLFFDLQSGQCNFDSQEFIEFLNFVKTLPTEADYSSYEQEISEGLQKNIMTPVSGLSQIIHSQVLFGDEISFIGLPTLAGETALIVPYYNIAITASSQCKEGAWSFLKQFLEDEYLEPYVGALFSLKLSSLAIEEESVRTYLAQHDGKFSFAIAGEEKEMSIDADRCVSLLNELLSSVNGVFIHNSAIYDIITADSAAFFAGDKTAQDVAKITQNRVSVYLAEQG
jgi:ABC-type glycerol-3-phosphate transport system substrate-binding protein